MTPGMEIDSPTSSQPTRYKDTSRGCDKRYAGLVGGMECGEDPLISVGATWG